jgi:hypothetical protein
VFHLFELNGAIERFDGVFELFLFTEDVLDPLEDLFALLLSLSTSS